MTTLSASAAIDEGVAKIIEMAGGSHIFWNVTNPTFDDTTCDAKECKKIPLTNLTQHEGSLMVIIPSYKEFETQFKKILQNKLTYTVSRQSTEDCKECFKIQASGITSVYEKNNWTPSFSPMGNFTPKQKPTPLPKPSQPIAAN